MDFRGVARSFTRQCLLDIWHVSDLDRDGLFDSLGSSGLDDGRRFLVSYLLWGIRDLFHLDWTHTVLEPNICPSIDYVIDRLADPLLVLSAISSYNLLLLLESFPRPP